jgi:hypothetical protein
MGCGTVRGCDRCWLGPGSREAKATTVTGHGILHGLAGLQRTENGPAPTTWRTLALRNPNSHRPSLLHLGPLNVIVAMVLACAIFGMSYFEWVYAYNRRTMCPGSHLLCASSHGSPPLCASISARP